MSRTCLVIRHVAFEGLGVLASLLTNLDFEIRCFDAGLEPFPVADMQSCDLLVVLGGPIGVYQVEDYPWLIVETAAIGERLRAQKPTLGICLGAQLMAASLGARVDPGQAKEIGYAPLSLTPTGLASVLAPFANEPVLHWHGDNFDLPRGSVRLAFTQACPNQAFAIENYALGLQFHLEVDPDALESWLIGHAVELSAAGVRPATLRKQAALHGAETAARGMEVIARWLEGVFA
ncbi:glutamine amidotransferase [Rhodoblastus acidophilus]|uniref:Glutamine amidotransferase n=1 Tax=Candidatus Rhodoblastus alkanivorans TaxID=2954117 RepID=A0ABS9Z919_9HYPH|nr:glutamine amidotransferase [Candidatus Rhodoblastus alkanivorans]MCI4679515.1 glutamine amidotransferase [Candidatus Rhodoblastus alkanivorans]MCI4683960.1 glutamine amidotransferase [Candidatus Rhodoblastus alkanivorans]MDI4641279.1 glutamine amidotransferase [Rhodoblastus acidophilus]